MAIRVAIDREKLPRLSEADRAGLAWAMTALVSEDVYPDMPTILDKLYEAWDEDPHAVWKWTGVDLYRLVRPYSEEIGPEYWRIVNVYSDAHAKALEAAGQKRRSPRRSRTPSTIEEE